jgi:hypothetical protein
MRRVRDDAEGTSAVSDEPRRAAPDQWDRQMTKETIIKEDGRYLIYYWFSLKEATDPMSESPNHLNV